MIVGEGEDLEIIEHGKGSTYIGLSENSSSSGFAETIIYSASDMQKIIDIMIVNRDRMLIYEARE